MTLATVVLWVGLAVAALLAVRTWRSDGAERGASAKVLATLKERKESFTQFAMRQSLAHAEFFRSEPLSSEEQARFESLAQKSLTEQTRLEKTEVGDFDLFVGAYQASILAVSP